MFLDIKSTNVASGTEERAVSWNQKKLGLYLLSVPICVNTTRLTDMIPLYAIFRSSNFTKLHENVSKQHITLDKKIFSATSYQSHWMIVKIDRDSKVEENIMKYLWEFNPYWSLH